MATNSYDESFSDTLKKFAPTLIVIGIILGILVGVFFYLRSQNKNAASSVTESSFVREYNFKEGNADSKVKLVEGFDLQCPACKAAKTPVNQFKAEYKDKVLFVNKHFPLSIHTFAKAAAYGLQASKAQGKYNEFKSVIFDKQSTISNALVDQTAKDLGLDYDKWNKDRNSQEIRSQIEQDEKDFKDIVLPNSTFGASGNKPNATPTFIILKDDKIVDWWSGGATVEEMKTRVDKYLI